MLVIDLPVTKEDVFIYCHIIIFKLAVQPQGKFFGLLDLALRTNPRLLPFALLCVEKNC